MNPQAEVKSFGQIDPVWEKIREEAQAAVETDKVIAGFIYDAILNHETLEQSLSYHLSQRLDHSAVDASTLNRSFNEIISNDEKFRQSLRIDLAAVFERDPACNRLVEPLLYLIFFICKDWPKVVHFLYQ